MKKFYWPKMFQDVKLIPRRFRAGAHSISKSDIEFNCILVIEDDFNGFLDMYPCSSPKWYSSFNLALTRISDQGSHFKSGFLKELNRKLTANII